MDDAIQLRLLPLGKTLKAKRGTPLRDLLFHHGVEYPCGGKGECKGCRVRVLAGDIPSDRAHRDMLSEDELKAGWRLSCQSRAQGDLDIELGLWRPDILVDNTPFHFSPREGYGVAIDLGTTTIAMQRVDLARGQVLSVKTGLNVQAKYGADVMSRVAFACEPGGLATLRDAIRDQLGALIRALLRSPTTAENGGAVETRSLPLREIVVVGNTAMHHLFCGLDAGPLASYPFEPVDAGEQVFEAQALGWTLAGNPKVRFLPCLGGFVGSDVLAGIHATRLFESFKPAALVDLGTNGEIVVGSNQRLICASTAAGPAFEGAKISCGMRAADGAIHRVTVEHGALACDVIGGSAARGLCGSGLVDAVAGGLDLGHVLASGRLAAGGGRLPLQDDVGIDQCDIRQLQLAKGAIAAGIRILANRLGLTEAGLDRLYLAGAFGNYVNRESARRIGLLKLPLEKIKPAGNTALLGAKLALFEPDNGWCDRIRAMTEHICLSADPEFTDVYADEMGFPGADAG